MAPEGSEPEPKRSAEHNFTATAMVVALVLVGTIVGYVFGAQSPDMEAGTALTVRELVEESSTSTTPFVSSTSNIAIDVPAGWVIGSPEEYAVRTPLWLVVKHPSTGCVITAGDYSEPPQGYRRVSQADAIESTLGPLNGWWYVSRDATAVGEHTVTQERLYLDNEMLIHRGYGFSMYSDTGMFALWNVEGKPVPDVCTGALASIIESMRYAYPPIRLTEDAVGSLWIKGAFGKTNGNWLVFTDASSTSHAVAAFESGMSLQEQRLYIHRGLVYGASVSKSQDTWNAHVFVVDPLKGTVDRIPGTEATFIASMYINGNTIYTLEGDETFLYCIEGPGTCEGKVYAFDLAKKTKQLIADNINVKSIAGYDSSATTLYLSGGYADAGCGYVEYVSLDTRTREIRERVKAGGCHGDAEFEDMIRLEESIESQFDALPPVQVVTFNKGTITPSPETRPIPEYSFVLVP